MDLSGTKVRLHRTGSVDISLAKGANVNWGAHNTSALPSRVTGGGSNGDAELRELRDTLAGLEGGLDSSMGFRSGGGGHPRDASMLRSPPRTPDASPMHHRFSDASRIMSGDISGIPMPMSSAAALPLAVAPPLPSSVTAPQHSRAVLTALRALQDKIRTLETEREHFSGQCSQLEDGLQQYRSTRERERLLEENNAQKRQQELQRLAETASQERNDFSVIVAKTEERNRSMVKELEYVKERGTSSEDERRQVVARNAALEARVIEVRKVVRRGGGTRRCERIRSGQERLIRACRFVLSLCVHTVCSFTCALMNGVRGLSATLYVPWFSFLYTLMRVNTHTSTYPALHTHTCTHTVGARPARRPNKPPPQGANVRGADERGKQEIYNFGRPRRVKRGRTDRGGTMRPWPPTTNFMVASTHAVECHVRIPSPRCYRSRKERSRTLILQQDTHELQAQLSNERVLREDLESKRIKTEEFLRNVSVAFVL